MFLTEVQFRDALHWYQKKIGSYDQPQWEKSIEERVIKGLSHAIPKKVARVKKESIDLDLDLIRGSYFAKAKPQQSWLTTTYLGTVRILLFPFYLKWWSQETNSLISGVLFALYCLQMTSIYIYFHSEKDFENVPASEVLTPLFMFVVLGTMQSQIGASNSSNKNRSFRSNKVKDYNYIFSSSNIFKSVVKSNRKTSKKKCKTKCFCRLRKADRDSTSSGNSDRSVSPSSPTGKISSDIDWASINSDGSSDEEAECVDEGNSDLFNLVDDNISVDDPLSKNLDGTFSQRTKKPFSDKVSCAIWKTQECQKIDLSVLDISSSIIRRVENVRHSNEYFYLGFILSLVLAFIPIIFRVRQLASLSVVSTARSVAEKTFSVNRSKEFGEIIQEIPNLATDFFPEGIYLSSHIYFVTFVAFIERFILSLCFFFLLCVVERTYRERFLYAKYFCHLTSSRRARRSGLPHFRLNKVRNIKTWLSVRSYLQNHGPQRSIDAIVSSSFIVEVSILTFLCIQLLRESELCSENLYCWEMVFWNLAIGLYIMRLIILGSKMNHKSRGCLTILLSEQINLYLQLEQKPHKKDGLTLANQLLKSAADVLKLLEAPFKISGFSANPYLYNITKVIVLSAFSAVLTELLGFKLKLYKIKLAP